MDKAGMRDWVSALEEVVDNKLKKWDKTHKWENGEAVQLRWAWEQTHIVIDVFWEDRQETVKLSYHSPRQDHVFTWHGLNNKTFNKVMDRVGNLAMGAMHPPIDPQD